MNTRIVNFLLGKLAFFVAAIFVLPLLVSLLYGDQGSMAFVSSIACALLTGVGFTFSGGFDKYRDQISNREGIATVVFAWLVVACLSALPYISLGVLTPVDAFFESMSGLTTTGATTLTAIEGLPKSLLFWRSLTHWLGGLGIIVIFIALLPQISGGAVHLFNAEVSGFSSDKMLPRLKNTALTLFEIYLLMTLVEIILLMCCGLDLYDALNHSMSTIATGGFSTYNNSVAHFNSPAVEFIIGVFMLLAGANFGLYYAATKHGIKVLWRDDEFRYYILFFALVVVLMTANIVYACGFDVATGLRHAFFQVASFASTTGFVSYDYDKWPAFSKILLTILYFTGGCAGSTAGGIKVSRFVVLVKMTFSEMRRTLHPNMLLSVSYNRRSLPIAVLASISRFFFIYVVCAVVLSLLVAATGVSVTEAVFGVTACLSSVGPGFGIIGAVGNFAHIPPFGKLVLALAMLLGRLELFTVLVLLRSEFWRKTRRW